jgi:chromosome segregation ATPase
MKNLLPVGKNFLGFFLSLLLLVSGLVLINPSLAIAETEDNPIATAVEHFLRSTLDPYRQNTEDSFRNSLKTLQTTVNELSERLEKAADPRTDEETRQQLREKITENRQALQSAAVTFTGLAERSLDWDGEIDRSLEELIATVKTRVHPRLTDSQESFTAIAAAISTLAEDIGHWNDANQADTLNQIGERINALNTAIINGDQAVKAFAD